MPEVKVLTREGIQEAVQKLSMLVWDLGEPAGNVYVADTNNKRVQKFITTAARGGLCPLLIPSNLQ